MVTRHMLDEHTVNLLQTPVGAHDKALALYENGEFERANEAFQQAAALSHSYTAHIWELDPRDPRLAYDNTETTIARDAVYGRVLLHWALSREAQFRYERDELQKRGTLTDALAKACRALVLLEQDQHRIVTDDEIDTAHALIERLESSIPPVPQTDETSPEQVLPLHDDDTSMSHSDETVSRLESIAA